MYSVRVNSKGITPMAIKVSKATEQQEYIWQVVSGEWFATATQTRYASRREALAATRAELDRVAALIPSR